MLCLTSHPNRNVAANGRMIDARTVSADEPSRERDNRSHRLKGRTPRDGTYRSGVAFQSAAGGLLPWVSERRPPLRRTMHRRPSTHRRRDVPDVFARAFRYRSSMALMPLFEACTIFA